MGNLFTVLRKGKQLAHPETWKNTQLAASILTAVLGLGLTLAKLFGADFEVSPADLDQFATGFALLVGSLFNAYATLGTTKKIGLPAKSEADESSRLGVGD